MLRFIFASSSNPVPVRVNQLKGYGRGGEAGYVTQIFIWGALGQFS